MSKGKRRERQAKNLYQDAGYQVETPVETKWDTNTDYFNYFDGMATNGTELRFYQVKSNVAQGITDHFVEAKQTVPEWCLLDFLVCHDRQGWRLAEASENGYTWTVDERDLSCTMGEEVIRYLESEVADSNDNE